MNAENPHLTVVGIGASAGGIQALREFFERVPDNPGMAFVVVVHLSPEHQSSLPGILQTTTRLPVTQVTEEVRVEADRVYVIPPARHLAFVDGVITLTEPEKIRGRRVPVDLLFRTLADAYGRHAIAIVLSGSGSDGALGIKRVKENGGITIAQEPRDADYDGMPRAAIATGLVDVVLPVAAIAPKVMSIARFPVRLAPPAEDTTERAAAASSAAALREVLTLLRIRTGHDFSNYKRPTLLRRIARRLQVHEMPDIAAYLNLLRENPEEVQALLRDVLITVTNFFRDKETFQALEEKVIPQLFAGKTAADCVRVWVAGSATGEEAYSIAILLHEFSARLPDPPRLQIFASDINEEAVRFSRDCCYDETIAADVSPERLQRYFVRKSEAFCVTKDLRETVLFAPHNLLRDPPFSRLDLVSCRNLLIYLNRETQEKVLEVFNFALKPGGFLFLGSSESAESLPSLYTAIDKKHRIYKSVGGNGHHHQQPVPVMPVRGPWDVRTPGLALSAEQPWSFGLLHHRIVERYAPPSVIVNQDGDILHASEHAGRYMRFAGGEPSRNLLKLVHPALQLDLRASLMAARQEGRGIESGEIRVKLEEGEKVVMITVQPVECQDTPAGCFLVMFQETPAAAQPARHPPLSETLGGNGAMEAVVARLEEELQNTRDRLRATIEQSETSTEELRASNEELQAINEELRSASEELETSKEELQSLNEELTTVNHELKEKVDEVSRVNSDLQNLMQSTDIGTLFLDRALCIKRYTPKVEGLFNIIASDIGRPFAHLTHKLDYDQLPADAAEVLQNLRVIERDVRGGTPDGCYLARLAPYRTMDDRIDGVVVSFLDVTDLKQAADTLRDRETHLRMAQKAAKAGVWNLFLRDGTAWWSDELSLLHGLEPGAIEMTVENWIARLHADSIAAVRGAMDTAVNQRAEYSFELKIRGSNGAARCLLEAGRAIYDDQGAATQMSGITLDVTERILWSEEQADLLATRGVAEEALRNADRRKDEFLAVLAHELRNPLSAICSGLDLLAGDDLEDDSRQALGVIDRQVAILVRLLDDLLDISRITKGKILLIKERVALADVLRAAAESGTSCPDARGHTIDLSLPDAPVAVEGDAARLTQVVVNVLHNAIKHTPPGSRIALSLRQEGNSAVVTVADQGDGIAPELLPEIFEMFTQARSGSGSRGGLGIGLALVKKLVELHGGSVAVQSPGTGLGATVIIHLPALADTSLGRSTVAARPPAMEKMPAARRILLVEDNSDAGQTLAKLLEKDGHTVHRAETGASALAILELFPPDIALLDIGLPDMSGFDLAAQIRQRLPGLAMVALSGWAQHQDRTKSKEAGMLQHLAKPVKIDEIRRILAATPVAPATVNA